MASYNKHFLLGNVGSIESRSTASGLAITDISLATNKKFKNKNTGDMEDRTEWHKLVAFDKRAEILAQYVGKGDPLFVVGESRTEKWQDKEGNDRYTVKVYIDDFQLLGSRQQGEQRSAPAQNAAPAKNEPLDTDIPF